MAVNQDTQADINAKISIPMFSFSDGQHELAKENVIKVVPFNHCKVQANI